MMSKVFVAVVLATLTSGCGHTAPMMVGAAGTLLGVKAGGMAIDRGFDALWPMRQEEDRRVLSGEFAEQLRLENERLRMENEEMKRGLDHSRLDY